MLRIEYPFQKQILACGAQREAGFCLTRKNCAFVVNDMGSLDEEEVFDRYCREIERWQKELALRPRIISFDLDGTYKSTRYAQQLTQERKGLKYYAVQHHQAHLASCLGEHRIKQGVIGVVFDCAGWGEDAQMWGGEFFIGDLQRFTRVAHLKYSCALERGLLQDARELAGSYLYLAYGESFVDLPIDFVRGKDKASWQILNSQPADSASTSSMAGLWDSLCVLIGVKPSLDFPGQGAIELERIVNRSTHVAKKVYDFLIQHHGDRWLICPEPILQNIVEDVKKNISKSIISAALHNTIVEIVCQLCAKIRRQEKLKQVVLTGALFQNKFLFKKLAQALCAQQFQVITHKHFPCNDSNIAFGQAILANAH